MPNVVDLFAGPGGLAEGFSSLIVNGSRQFNIGLSVEKEPVPFQTLRLRKFFRSFEPGHAPDAYYEFVAGRIKLKTLYDSYPIQAAAASERVIRESIGEYSRYLLDERIADAIDGDPKWVLIGGPPCQAYSTAGMVGNRTKKGYRLTGDPRFFLYREYLRAVAVHAPAVFIMENVKGFLMARAGEKSIAREVVRGLLRPDNFMFQEFGVLINAPRYRLFSLQAQEVTESGDINAFLVNTEDYGLPQARHRIIIIGVREDIHPLLHPPEKCERAATINEVIADPPCHQEQGLPSRRFPVDLAKQFDRHLNERLAFRSRSRPWRRACQVHPPDSFSA